MIAKDELAASALSDRKRCDDTLREGEARYRTLFDSIDEGFCIVQVLFDERCNPTDYRFLEVNAAFEKQTGIVDAVGKRIREIVPQHDEQWLRTYGTVALTGEPTRLESSSEALGRNYDAYAFRIGAPETRTVGVLFKDVSECKRAQEALVAERDFATAILDTIANVVVVLDTGGRIVRFNKACEHATGFAAAEVIGKEFFDIFVPEDELPGVRGVFERLRAGDFPNRHRNRWRMKDGSERLFEWANTCIADERGNVRFVIGTGIDITVRVKAEEELREADRRKTEFLAVLSHELRNPLAPITNSIYLLERAAPGTDQANRAREIMRRQTEHLTHLIDDLLDVTRISRGKFVLQRTRVDLREVVRRTTDDLLPAFANAGIELRVDYGTAGALWIDVDPTRMAQVLGNLLQNSVKFTQRGGTVTVKIAAGTGERAELRVRDNGVGMEPATLERMFAPFAQADQALARTPGGLGLGLALVKGIVEMHGGSVEARSEGLGLGAEFLVSIPLAEPRASPDHERVARAESGERRILVIEDNVDAAQSLADVLELHGHCVRVAHDGRPGLALAREFRPDVVLCDIGLPGLDGYEVARAIRGDDSLRAIRLIAVSGYAQPEDRQRARDAGFDAHIAKPPDVGELMAAIVAPATSANEHPHARLGLGAL